MTVLELRAKHDALQKIAAVRDPIKGIAEFIWNAVDADAKNVSVDIKRNELGGIEAITISDDGTGITQNMALSVFENLGDSWKRQANRTNSHRVLHGKEGQGRLRFFSIAEVAEWTSVSENDDHKQKIEIKIKAQSLHQSEVIEKAVDQNENSGTTVILAPLKQSFDWLGSKEASDELAGVFAPYLLQYPDVGITYDGRSIDPASTILHDQIIPTQTIICDGRKIDDLSIRVIEWSGSTGGRKLHFGGEKGVVLGSVPASITAPGFEFSAYAYSNYFEELADANLLEMDGLNDPVFLRLSEYIREKLTDYFRERQSQKSGALIQRLKDAGVYPYEGDPKDAVEERERQVFDIATHAVSSYSSEFKKADDPQKKITLSLLREAVRHNPDSIHNILHHVFHLPKNRQDEFSALLRKTNLGNIISASTLIADRIVALEVLKGIVFSPTHRHTIKERGELDVLVQSNTWLFGENYHITLPEAGLTKVMQRVSEELESSRKRSSVRKPDGKSGRVDNFLGRRVPHPDPMHREFLVIELKKPSATIARKEADQLEDYVNAIREEPDFNNTSTHWNFFLITGEYDDTVGERITQSGRPFGLMIDKPTHGVWVKTWGEIIRECEARLQFIAERLKIEVSTDEIEQRIAALKTTFVGES